MTNVEARLRTKGKEFQVLVALEKALDFKKGGAEIGEALVSENVFYDLKKGLKASSSELEKAFGTSDVNEVAGKIIKQGEVVLPAEYRKQGQEARVKQMVEFLAKNALDASTGNAISQSRIEQAIEQAGVKIENKPIEQQVNSVLSKLKNIIPIKLETKKLRIIVSAVHTGQVYGLFQEYKEKEEWLSNGDLQVVINIPAGLEMDFYDKLNAITHGSAIVEEVKERK